MMGWHGGGMGFAGWLGMGVFWFVLLGLLVWLFTRVVSRGGGKAGPAAGEPVLDVLDRRLAAGELDLETWQAQRAALLAARDDGH